MNVIIFIRDSECYKINTLIITHISNAKLQPQILKSLGKDKAVVCSKKSIIKKCVSRITQCLIVCFRGILISIWKQKELHDKYFVYPKINLYYKYCMSV